MKKQLIYITLLFAILITVMTLIFINQAKSTTNEDNYSQKLVDLNEIVKLSEKKDIDSTNKLEQAIYEFREKLSAEQGRGKETNIRNTIGILYGLCILFLILIFVYVYRAILRPFNKMEIFAKEIAKGNFDLDLKYERSNYFGKFTWAFDHMRREITKARACEKEAIDNNKTVIATLSHDIKTPIASIRAYAEGLDANLDAGPEMRRKYSEVILKKCDEVTNLTDDLFLHSLSDMDKLKVNPRKVKIQEFLLKIVSELQFNDNKISLCGDIPDVIIVVDDKRFEQVIENLINNAKKYAPGSNVEINVGIEAGNINICLRDFGQGIPDEDIPFIFDKFYRGRNAGEQEGSGLGLYIVKYIMEQMGGSVSILNTHNGLWVTLQLPYSS